MRIVIISGGFDPIHKGHIELIRKARIIEEGNNIVICILNSDEFLMRKKGFVFQNFEERKTILENLKYIDVIVPCIDNDQTVCQTLRMIKFGIDTSLKLMGEFGPSEFKYCKYIFANGGDRHNDEIPEAAICKELGIEMVDGLGEKIQSSRYLVLEADKKRMEVKK